jgi:hypothetical protein
MYTNFGRKSELERDHFEDLGLNGRAVKRKNQEIISYKK